jgi:hypothetical protein
MARRDPHFYSDEQVLGIHRNPDCICLIHLAVEKTGRNFECDLMGVIRSDAEIA